MEPVAHVIHNWALKGHSSSVPPTFEKYDNKTPLNLDEKYDNCKLEWRVTRLEDTTTKTRVSSEALELPTTASQQAQQ